MRANSCWRRTPILSRQGKEGGSGKVEKGRGAFTHHIECEEGGEGVLLESHVCYVFVGDE